MKAKKLRVQIVLAILTILVIAGCAIKNPNYQPPPAPQDPVTNPAYLPDVPGITNSFGLARGVNQVTAPANPFSTITGVLIDNGEHLALGIAALIAALKSRTAAKKTKALDTMSVGVIAAGPAAVKAVTDAAANSTPNDHAEIKAALDDNTA